MTVNLASEQNAAKINQRFKELEHEILELNKKLKSQENAIQTQANKLTTQMELYTQFFVQQYGNGPTVKE